MKMLSLLYRLLPGTVVLLGSAALILLSPSLTIASEGSAEFFVAAWLVRLWLALVSGTVIVVGVLLALDSYSAKHTTEPVLNSDGQVTMVKKRHLSYRKIGGGLLCVVIGSALFVTSVFLLPDKRTGHSGIGKVADHLAHHFKVDIVNHFKKDQVAVEESSGADVSHPADRQH